MTIHYVRPDISGELRNPFDCDELVVKALVTVSAFVALADGRLVAIERDEAVNYIERQQLAPTISRQRVADAAVAGGLRRKTFAQATLQIVAADISMSLDNVLAIAGAAREHRSSLLLA